MVNGWFWFEMQWMSWPSSKTADLLHGWFWFEMQLTSWPSSKTTALLNEDVRRSDSIHICFANTFEMKWTYSYLS